MITNTIKNGVFGEGSLNWICIQFKSFINDIVDLDFNLFSKMVDYVDLVRKPDGSDDVI